MNGDEDFERRIKQALDASVSGMDGETRSRITAIRHAALQQPRPAWWRNFNVLVPAAALAAAAIFAVTLLIDNPVPDASQQIAQEDSDTALELVLGEEAPSDPDFYVWLDEMLLEQEDTDNAT